MPAKKRAADRVDKRYKTKMVIPGQEKPVWITGKTKKELEDKKRKLRQELIDGVVAQDRPFVELLVEWFNTDKRPTIKSESTLKNWQNAINLHILPHMDHRKLCKAVRYSDLKQIMNLLEGKNETTIGLVHSALVHACHYAVREGLILRDPSLDLGKATPKNRDFKDAFTEEETTRIMDAAAHDDFGLYIYILYYTGMRRGEALGLRWGDVDWQAKAVHVQRDVDYNAGHTTEAVIGSVKNPQSVRWVPLPDDLVAILRPLRGLPDIPIVNVNGHHLTYNEFSYRWGRIMVRAGFGTIKPEYYDRVEKLRKEGKKVHGPNPKSDYTFSITPHYFRHNYITACVLAGIQPEITMHIVGHKDYSTTVNIYTHIKAQHNLNAAVNLTGVLRKVDNKLTSGVSG